MEDFGAVLGTTSEQREAKDRHKKVSKNLKQYILRVFHNPEDKIFLVRDIKYPTIVLNTSRPTALSVDDEKDSIMVVIQTEEIKQFVKKRFNPTEKLNKDLGANLVTVISSTSEQIGGRPRIYHQVSNIQLPLAVHQGQDLYILN